MSLDVIQEGNYKYVDSKSESREILFLLHGLFGGLSNFSSIYNYFKEDYRVIIPVLPIVDIPARKAGIMSLVEYVEGFVEDKQLTNLNLLGNSLGGHIAQLFALRQPSKINTMTLTGSSGLFEDSLGGSYLRRGDYDYIREKAEYTFYDPNTATKEMIDEVYEAVNNRNKAIKLVITAKSAIRLNLEKKLNKIKAPTLLIWGKEDKITPPFVANKFKSLIKNSKLYFIDKCGHAPMMERPEYFNKILKEFLVDVQEKEPIMQKMSSI